MAIKAALDAMDRIADTEKKAPKRKPKPAFELHHASIGNGRSSVWRDDVTDSKHVTLSLIEMGTLTGVCRLLEIPLVDKTPTKR